ncbi:MAG: guanylate kinase [Clostridia bacterium]|nr:guanylate kinase [Clostridia bacterium]
MRLKRLENSAKTLSDSTNRGELFIVSGPSGVGKGTVCKYLLERMPSIVSSVSVTTRQPRTGERDGVEYFFISIEQFEHMRDNGELLEYNKHFDNYYGTPANYVFDCLNKGEDILCEIEMVGAAQIKERFPKARTFFILPPNSVELRNRLLHRGTETTQQIENRLSRVEYEMQFKSQYDYCIINDTVERAVQEIIDIIRSIKNDNKTIN